MSQVLYMLLCDALHMENIKTFTPSKTSSNGSLSAHAATFKWHQLPAAAVLPTLRSFLVHINRCRTVLTWTYNGVFFLYFVISKMGVGWGQVIIAHN